MFIAIIVACGLPGVEGGCGFSMSKKMFMTQELCEVSVMTEGAPHVIEGLPEGGYISDVRCLEVETSKPA